MDVGFTGTQRGMTPHQMAVVRDILRTLGGGEFHHGDCIGADSQAHDIALDCGYLPILHPPNDPKKRAWREVPSHLMRSERAYLVRNRHIVDETKWLIAAPGEPEEQLRSGTWSTVRYAKRRGKKIALVLPNGRVL